jgi:signal transduction histidine kinase/CheY-like chemotaxis protein
MTTTDLVGLASGRVNSPVRDDLIEFRRGAFVRIVLVTCLAFWLVTIDALRLSQPSLWSLGASGLLLLGIITSLTLHLLRRAESASVLAVLMVMAATTMVLAYPHGPARWLCSVVVLLCFGMLSEGQRLGLTLVAAVALALVESLVPETRLGWGTAWGPIATVVLTALAYGVTQRQLMLALEWARRSSEEALSLTNQLRERQLVLNRTMRAADEANERLALTNARLLEVWEAAEEARQAKARFAANISHELRTPLNLILGFAEVMYTRPRSYGGVVLTPDFLLDLEALYRNAQHLSELVDDVLDLSQLDAGKLSMDLRIWDLREIVGEVTDMSQQAGLRPGVRLETALPAELPALRLDRTRIRQVLLNLLANAARHTYSGTIRVAVTVDDRQVSCTVADTGPGIPPDKLSRLFQEFEMLGESSGPGHRGSGLGLAISRRFIEAHGGHIWCRSVVDQGSSFGFSLPLFSTPASTLASPLRAAPPERSKSQTRDTLLIATQSQIAARFFSRNLVGLHCLASPSLEQVKQQLLDLQPMGVLVDRAMGNNALSSLQTAAEGTAVRNIPVIACPMPDMQRRGELRGIRAYLTKPVDQQALLAAVRTLGSDVETVLIVDDDADIVRLFKRYLNSQATRYCRVITAQDGAEALERVREVRPDLIILDLLLPIMDGYQFLGQLQSNPAWRDLPVIVVSGQDAVDAGERVVGQIVVAPARELSLGHLGMIVSAVLAAFQSPPTNGPGPETQPGLPASPADART